MALQGQDISIPTVVGHRRGTAQGKGERGSGGGGGGGGGDGGGSDGDGDDDDDGAAQRDPCICVCIHVYDLMRLYTRALARDYIRAFPSSVRQCTKSYDQT